jgi:hypothetical protein
MKKKAKKLVLTKETLRSLEVVTLNEVVGGSVLPMFACGGGTASCDICDPEPISAETNC